MYCPPEKTIILASFSLQEEYGDFQSDINGNKEFATRNFNGIKEFDRLLPSHAMVMALSLRWEMKNKYIVFSEIFRKK